MASNSNSGQKFISRNRKPRVHITYEDPYDAEKLVELPFVMGVLADLSGNASDIAKPDMSTATSFFSMITQMSMGMGVAVGAIALRVAGFLDGNAMGAPTTKEFHIAFLLVAVLSVLATLDCFLLAPDAGATVSGHRLDPIPDKTSAAT